jgi:bifunctional DNase/RNase
MSTFNIELTEVIIYKLEEGIFFAKLVCQNNTEVIEIESRTSDALALAVRANCRIFTYENILETAGLYLDQSGEGQQAEGADAPRAQTASAAAGRTDIDKDLKSMNLDELNTLLQQVLDQEDYVRAITIRDEINSRKSK